MFIQPQNACFELISKVEQSKMKVQGEKKLKTNTKLKSQVQFKKCQSDFTLFLLIV